MRIRITEPLIGWDGKPIGVAPIEPPLEECEPATAIDREFGLRLVALGVTPFCEEHGARMFWEEGLVCGHWECGRCLEPDYSGPEE